MKWKLEENRKFVKERKGKINPVTPDKTIGQPFLDSSLIFVSAAVRGRAGGPIATEFAERGVLGDPTYVLCTYVPRLSSGNKVEKEKKELKNSVRSPTAFLLDSDSLAEARKKEKK